MGTKIKRTHFFVKILIRAAGHCVESLFIKDANLCKAFHLSLVTDRPTVSICNQQK